MENTTKELKVSKVEDAKHGQHKITYEDDTVTFRSGQPPAIGSVEQVPVSMVNGDRPKKKRGFAVMDPKKVSEIASKGGKAAHAAGTAHEFSRAEAREAGRKGGYATHAARKAKDSQKQP